MSFDVAAERVGDRADVLADRPAAGRSAPRARGPTAILRMYMSGSVQQRAGLADGDHRHRAVAAARDDAAALERVEREVDRPRRRRRRSSPTAQRRPPPRRADHDAAADRQLVERRRASPRTAASSAPSCVGAAEPARAGERRALGRARVRLAAGSGRPRSSLTARVSHRARRSRRARARSPRRSASRCSRSRSPARSPVAARSTM